jgi:hypothetical protein
METAKEKKKRLVSPNLILDRNRNQNQNQNPNRNLHLNLNPISFPIPISISMVSRMTAVLGDCQRLLGYCYTADSSASMLSSVSSSCDAASDEAPRPFPAFAKPPARPALTFLL